MSALPPKADIVMRADHARFVTGRRRASKIRLPLLAAIGANRGVRVHRNIYNALHQEE